MTALGSLGHRGAEQGRPAGQRDRGPVPGADHPRRPRLPRRHRPAARRHRRRCDRTPRPARLRAAPAARRGVARSRPRHPRRPAHPVGRRQADGQDQARRRGRCSRHGIVDLFAPFPIGVDPRGRAVTVTLMFALGDHRRPAPDGQDAPAAAARPRRRAGPHRRAARLRPERRRRLPAAGTGRAPVPGRRRPRRPGLPPLRPARASTPTWAAATRCSAPCRGTSARKARSPAPWPTAATWACSRSCC